MIFKDNDQNGFQRQESEVGDEEGESNLKWGQLNDSQVFDKEQSEYDQGFTRSATKVNPNKDKQTREKSEKDIYIPANFKYGINASNINDDESERSSVFFNETQDPNVKLQARKIEQKLSQNLLIQVYDHIKQGEHSHEHRELVFLTCIPKDKGMLIIGIMELFYLPLMVIRSQNHLWMEGQSHNYMAWMLVLVYLPLIMLWVIVQMQVKKEQFLKASKYNGYFRGMYCLRLGFLAVIMIVSFLIELDDLDTCQQYHKMTPKEKIDTQITEAKYFNMWETVHENCISGIVTASVIFAFSIPVMLFQYHCQWFMKNYSQYLQHQSCEYMKIHEDLKYNLSTNVQSDGNIRQGAGEEAFRSQTTSIVDIEMF